MVQRNGDDGCLEEDEDDDDLLCIDRKEIDVDKPYEDMGKVVKLGGREHQKSVHQAASSGLTNKHGSSRAKGTDDEYDEEEYDEEDENESKGSPGIKFVDDDYHDKHGLSKSAYKKI